MNTPVVLILYKRIDAIVQHMEILRQVQPEKLYLVGDAAKTGDAETAKLVQQVREKAQDVIWPCQVTTIFAEENMGCDRRIISGLDEVFQQEEAAIILEDDCIPDVTFFRYCDEMLATYRDNPDVFYVSGNHLCPWQQETSSYIFSRRGDTWGWATWANRWQQMSTNFEKEWNSIKSQRLLQQQMGTSAGEAYIRELEHYKNQSIIPWDYQWHARCLAYGKKVIVPGVNLVSNIGFDGAATHTAEAPGGVSMERFAMEFPMTPPATENVNRKYDRARQREIFQVSLWTRIKRRIRRIGKI